MHSGLQLVCMTPKFCEARSILDLAPGYRLFTAAALFRHAESSGAVLRLPTFVTSQIALSMLTLKSYVNAQVHGSLTDHYSGMLLALGPRQFSKEENVSHNA